MTSIYRPFTLSLCGGHSTYAELRYDTRDPLVMQLVAIEPSGGENPWTFPRLLFAEAVAADASTVVDGGGIRFYRRGSFLFVQFRNGEGFAEGWFPHEDAQLFTAGMYRLVADGAGFDEALAVLVEDGAR